MKTTILILFSFLIGGLVCAQELPNLLSSTKISTIGYWKNGDKCTYQVIEEKTKFKVNSEKIASQHRTESEIELTIVDSTAKTYVFEAKHIQKSENKGESEIEQLLNDFQMESVIRYQTDELGSFDTILNLPELRDELLEKFELLKKILNEKEDHELAKSVSNLIDNYIDNFTSLEDIESLFMVDIISIHGIYGVELVVGNTLELDMEFPVLGKMTLSGTGKLSCLAINRTQKTAIITWLTKPNKEELKGFLMMFLTLFTDGLIKKIDLQAATISCSNKMKYTMDLTKGWMDQIIDTQIITLSDSKDKVKNTTTKTYIRK